MLRMNLIGSGSLHSILIYDAIHSYFPSILCYRQMPHNFKSIFFRFLYYFPGRDSSEILTLISISKFISILGASRGAGEIPVKSNLPIGYDY